MHVIQYLKNHGLEALQEEFGIRVREYDDLLLLNYNQINSPKEHPITIECRSLILNRDYNIVSRSFDRFFNYGEYNDFYHGFDFDNALVLDKRDGSLIKLYFYNDTWHFSTRGTAFAEAPMPLFESTYGEHITQYIFGNNEQFKHFTKALDPEYTYIFEFTSPHNRIVTKYDDDRLTLIGIRQNSTEGTYFSFDDMKQEYTKKMNHEKIDLIQTYNVNGDYQDFVETFSDLKEGIILWDVKTHKRIKIKNSLYVKLHLIKGSGITENNAIDLVLKNETDEYLNYFPEDTDFVMPYKKALKHIKSLCEEIIEDLKDIPIGKEFASSKILTGEEVKKSDISSILFSMKKGLNFTEVFFSLTYKKQSWLIESYHKKLCDKLF